jgi:hypothetical protein
MIKILHDKSHLIFSKKNKNFKLIKIVSRPICFFHMLQVILHQSFLKKRISSYNNMRQHISQLPKIKWDA